MDRIDMAIALLQEAKEEKERLEAFHKAEASLPDYDNPYYYNALNELYSTFTPIPKKSVINDNIKMARRLLLGEYV